MKIKTSESCEQCRWVMHVESGRACFRQDVDEKDCNFTPENASNSWPMRTALTQENWDDPDLILLAKENLEPIKKDINPWILLAIFVFILVFVGIFIH